MRLGQPQHPGKQTSLFKCREQGSRDPVPSGPSHPQLAPAETASGSPHVHSLLLRGSSRLISGVLLLVSWSFDGCYALTGAKVAPYPAVLH